MALAGALCQTLLAATGFTSKNLRVLTAGLLGSDYTPGQMTYDLRRLRLNGLIRRGSRRPTATYSPPTASAWPSSAPKVTTGCLSRSPPRTKAQAPPELRTALSAITRHVDDYAGAARLPRAA